MFACLECGRKFRTTKAAEKAANDGCPGCGGSDIDLDTSTPTSRRTVSRTRRALAVAVQATPIKTAEQILADAEAERQEFERTTFHNGFSIAHLRETMDAVQSPLGWKRPFETTVSVDKLSLVLTAVEFFHADAPTVDGFDPRDMTVRVRGNGYQG